MKTGDTLGWWDFELNYHWKILYVITMLFNDKHN